MAADNCQLTAAAYAHCQQQVRSHYENFPVASFILPKRLRQPISVIYAFARTADDFADEGDDDAETRLAKLTEYDEYLHAITAGETIENPIFIALADVIEKHQLPLPLFHDLLTAFRLDVTKTRFADIDEIWNYCRYSANPVGRLLLHLMNAATPQNLKYSDAICSALQLINFLQDIEQDFVENQRIYLPQADMERFGVNEKHFQDKHSDAAFTQLIQQQIAYAREKILFGKPLGRAVGGRFGFQLRLMINGGLRVLELLECQQGNLFSRPRLSKADWLMMVLRSV
ncbi:MAG: squalene synthase HpnC [Gammaproteobacteria bacterium]|nr:squalene synthase HpnC [Gammaproteobacteria bacterium]